MARTVRLSESLQERVDRFSGELGLSFNALVIVALNDYILKNQGGVEDTQTSPAIQQNSNKGFKNSKRRKKK
jgi:hypothetical protein